MEFGALGQLGRLVLKLVEVGLNFEPGHAPILPQTMMATTAHMMAHQKEEIKIATPAIVVSSKIELLMFLLNNTLNFILIIWVLKIVNIF